ncbi:CCD87 protein, partial [Polypterus senegalus]|nr:CCD87 protein [Polypterus senegalus]
MEVEDYCSKVRAYRPVTPIKDSVKGPPSSLAELCELIHRRICVRQDIPTVSTEFQKAFGGIILAEIKMLWQDINQFVPDPFLSSAENNALQIRIITHIILVCEKLFLHYLHLMDVLRKRSVFSDEANFSRLGAELSIDCTKLLNVNAIRRNIILDIKATRKNVNFVENLQLPQSFNQPVKSTTHKNSQKLQRSLIPHLTFEQLMSLSRQAVRQPKESSIEKDLKEIKKKMPNLDFKRLYKLLPCQDAQEGHPTPCVAVRSPAPPLQTAKELDYLIDKKSDHPSQLKRSQSMPNLHGKLLTEILGVNLEEHRPQTPLLVSQYSCQEIKEHNEIQISADKDLQRLLQIYDLSVKDAENTEDETDLPPLVKSLPYRNDVRFKQLQKHLEKLKLEEKKEETKEQMKNMPSTKPEHPQAATVAVTLSNKSVARTADVQVSDRVLMDTIQLQKYPPLYNDLTGEIEQSTVQWMDRNLFYGQEITEVYKELIRNIPAKHLLFDQDPLIQPCAKGVNFSKCQASSTLQKSRKNWIINPDLRTESHSQWCRRKNDNDYQKPEDTSSRAYTSWLQWWKSNINTDDYLKYISTKDSDYLGVVFHFYNSDDSDDEEDEIQKKINAELKQKEMEYKKKINNLLTKKQEFVSGLWNINCVMLGGLGKDPTLKDGEDEFLESMESPKEAIAAGHVYPVTAARPDNKELQNRLEQIWKALHFSDKERLDMAIKYSSSRFKEDLEAATTAWEEAVRLIQQREVLLDKLEQFERDASDPNRFFGQGYRGTSTARMNESKKRASLSSKIKDVEALLSRALDDTKTQFKDIVTYKGRPYVEKMRWDKIEMLYWLQQERRTLGLEKVLSNSGGLISKLTPLHLPPVPFIKE